jgi:hypothetical protein
MAETDWDAIKEEKQRHIMIGQATSLAQQELLVTTSKVSMMDLKVLTAKYFEVLKGLHERLK